MFEWIKALFKRNETPSHPLQEEQTMSVVKDVQTVAQTEAVTHAGIISSIEAEVDKIVASANSLSARTFKDVESLPAIKDVESFAVEVKNYLIGKGKMVEAEAEAMFAEIRAKL